MKTITDELPKAWTGAGWVERRTELLKLPKRVRVVLAAEWARSVLPIFEAKRPGDERPRKAILAAEGWASEPTEEMRKAAYASAASAASAAYASAAASAAYASAAASAAASASAAYADAAYADAAASAAYADAAASAAYADAAYAARRSKWKWVYATYRHALGPDGLTFAQAWRTETAVSLARGIVAERAFERLPILADALQDAGCDHEELIRHLQDDTDEWTGAEWVLWNLLGYGEDVK